MKILGDKKWTYQPINLVFIVYALVSADFSSLPLDRCLIYVLVYGNSDCITETTSFDSLRVETRRLKIFNPLKSSGNDMYQLL
jgi:hypothetical protein